MRALHTESRFVGESNLSNEKQQIINRHGLHS